MGNLERPKRNNKTRHKSARLLSCAQTYYCEGEHEGRRLNAAYRVSAWGPQMGRQAPWILVTNLKVYKHYESDVDRSNRHEVL